MAQQERLQVFIHKLVVATIVDDYRELETLFTVKERVIFKTQLGLKLTYIESEYKKEYKLCQTT